MKVYFTAEEMHTPEYREYVKWVSECWRLNDERNKRIEFEKTRPPVTEAMKENAKKLAKELYQNHLKRKNTFWSY